MISIEHSSNSMQQSSNADSRQRDDSDKEEFIEIWINVNFFFTFNRESYAISQKK